MFEDCNLRDLFENFVLRKDAKINLKVLGGVATLHCAPTEMWQRRDGKSLV